MVGNEYDNQKSEVVINNENEELENRNTVANRNHKLRCKIGIQNTKSESEWGSKSGIGI